MTQEEKELLIKDICARLPYGVKAKVNVNQQLERLIEPVYIGEDGKDTYLCSSTISIHEDNIKYVFNGLFECKPYLFPMSSMTKEQKKEYNNLCETILDDLGYPASFNTIDSLDWLNKNYFDYRGLIYMGLAIDATGKNIY